MLARDKPVSAQEQPSPEVANFSASITGVDGALVPLDRLASNGARLFITARIVANPNLEDSPDADEWFYGWDRERSSLGAFTSVALIDTYAQNGDSVVPIGHMDWWLQEDYANGGGNMHAAAVPKNDHEQLSLDRWGGRWGCDSTAFKLDTNYHGQRIGSLMLATSSLVLPSIGVSKFYTGVLLQPAINTYANFGITPTDFTRAKEPGMTSWMKTLPIDRLSQNHNLDQTIQHFVSPV